ncbi:hypothetical protein HanPI659440_Chr16g0658881 [Helianthus annuus]|nr:hypothetical protein HanPI659440_Chr16g0658881 [Helianthus annuus]
MMYRRSSLGKSWSNIVRKSMIEVDMEAYADSRDDGVGISGKVRAAIGGLVFAETGDCGECVE